MDQQWCPRVQRHGICSGLGGSRDSTTQGAAVGFTKTFPTNILGLVAIDMCQDYVDSHTYYLALINLVYTKCTEVFKRFLPGSLDGCYHEECNYKEDTTPTKNITGHALSTPGYKHIIAHMEKQKMDDVGISDMNLM